MQQMRIYTINRGKMDEFVRVWQLGVAPIRRKVGFDILGAWVNKETNQFIWLLSYDGPDEWSVKRPGLFQLSRAEDSRSRPRFSDRPHRTILRRSGERLLVTIL